MAELAQRVKLRGFRLFFVIRCWEILQSPTNAARRCPLLQDDNRGCYAHPSKLIQRYWALGEL